MPLLSNDIWRIELSRCIDQANQTHQFELVAFVYMPEQELPRVHGLRAEVFDPSVAR